MENFRSKTQMYMHVSMVGGGTVYPKGGQCILGYIVRRRTSYPGGQTILLQGHPSRPARRVRATGKIVISQRGISNAFLLSNRVNRVV